MPFKFNPLTGKLDLVNGGLADPGANGILARTALNTTTARTLTGTTNQVTITNGDGVAGNPTFSLPQNIHTGASPTFAGLTTNGGVTINGITSINGSASNGFLYITSSNGQDRAALVLTGKNASNLNDSFTLDIRTDQPDVIAYAYDNSTSTFYNTFRHAYLNNTFTLYANVQPNTDSTQTLGTSSLYWSNTYTDRLYLNATADFNGSVAGTANLTGFLGIAATSGAATHSLTLGSAATGITHYNTSDQTTNYERIRNYWSGNVYRVGALEIGGTGTTRDVRFGNTTTYLNVFGPNYGLGFVAGNSGVASGYNASFSGTLSASSGTQYALTQTTTISQSGTAGYTGLSLNVTESTTGSGTKLLIDAQVGGAARFSVDNNGNIRAGGLLNTASFNNSRIQPLSTGTKIDRNIADANTALTVNQVHASSTGLILDTQFGGASIFNVNYNGLITLANASNIAVGTTTGTKIATATTQKLGFWNATPIVQQTTASAAAAFVSNTSLIVNDTATFDGYTIGQVVKILRNLGILA